MLAEKEQVGVHKGDDAPPAHAWWSHWSAAWSPRSDYKVQPPSNSIHVMMMMMRMMMMMMVMMTDDD